MFSVLADLRNDAVFIYRSQVVGTELVGDSAL